MNPASVLVVVTRRIGDVLLTTPLIDSLRRAWPRAAIDVLVFDGTQGVLAGNPDIRRVLAVPARPSLGAHLKFAAALWRRYDVALSVVPGDRPTLYAWMAGRWRAGLVPDTAQHRWKQWLLQRWVAFDGRSTHTVLMHLALARALGLPAHYEVTAACSEADRAAVRALLPSLAATADAAPSKAPGPSYAVLHPYPRFNYKSWHRAGWLALARWLQARGLMVVFSGGSDAAERAYVADIARELPGAVDLSGRLTLAQVACLLGEARLYVGPDTAVTHMAAAAGVPVIALYGPSDPLKWGPWPADYTREENPWRRHGTQRAGNVTLLQGQAACVPCLLEGCDRHIESFSDCLQQLAPEIVIAAAAERLDAGLFPGGSHA